MLAFNEHQQATIKEINYVTLVLFFHPKSHTTCNIQVMDMGVSNYSIIIGHNWKDLTNGYLFVDDTHVIISRGPKNLIVYREGKISHYLESIS
jgi:hypothetical protein